MCLATVWAVGLSRCGVSYLEVAKPKQQAQIKLQVQMKKKKEAKQNKNRSA